MDIINYNSVVAFIRYKYKIILACHIMEEVPFQIVNIFTSVKYLFK